MQAGSQQVAGWIAAGCRLDVIGLQAGSRGGGTSASYHLQPTSYNLPPTTYPLQRNVLLTAYVGVHEQRNLERAREQREGLDGEGAQPRPAYIYIYSEPRGKRVREAVAEPDPPGTGSGCPGFEPRMTYAAAARSV